MELLNGLGCFLIYGSIAAVIIYIMSSIKPQANQTEKVVKTRAESLAEDVELQMRNAAKWVDDISQAIKWSFKTPNGEEFKGISKPNYDTVGIYLKICIENINYNFTRARALNRKLMAEDPYYEKSSEIAWKEQSYLSHATYMRDRFVDFGKKVSKFSQASRMMVDINQGYGTINAQYLQSVKSLSQETPTPELYISQCYDLLDTNEFNRIYYNIDLEKVLMCVWYFSILKNRNDEMHRMAMDVFIRIYKYAHSDFILAGCFFKKMWDGEEATNKLVQSMLKSDPGSYMLNTLASGLMWMGAYESEKLVLQYMAANNKQMTSAAQARLKQLTSK